MTKLNHIDSVATVAHALDKHGCTTQWTEEKQMDVDILATLPNDNIIKIVVRTVSADSQYTWINQKKFDIKDESLYIAALYIRNNIDKEIYLLPATEWQKAGTPFSTKNYDKPGLISEPEFGINFSQKTLEKLNAFRLSTMFFE